MTIEEASKNDKKTWNDFVSGHYPPIGGFMQSWEWGVFQEKLGRDMARYFVMDSGRPIAAFTLTHHDLPMGMRYGYAARGPVVAASHAGKVSEICAAIRSWAAKEFPDLLFMRLEPPVVEAPADLSKHAPSLRIPSYYIQPRYNLAVPVDKTEEEILGSLHPSTRSNINRAQKRGVEVEMLDNIAPGEYEHFKGMMKDTIQRNSGTNAYPSDSYFDALFATMAESEGTEGLSLGAFYGRQNGEPAATHFVLFFGDTATYLYGAARTKHLRSKVPTYLHWAAMREAKRRGMKYYDLGGIDEKRWPKLTDFKRQFRGKEFSYVGNIDIPLRPLAYRAYNLLRGFKK
jgi:lipid II:glycine glycyltransferase (peptidoglycan interpeptide bridge formation enzyme)